MDLGFALPQYGDMGDLARVAEFARTVEDLGYDSLWVGDRLLTPTEPSDLYPEEPKPYPPAFTTAGDPIVVWTAAAAATARVRLGSSTVNAPWYNAVQLARALTTLDAVSGGRIDVGFGTSWMRDEYRSSGAAWQTRGQRLDETIDLLRTWWTRNPVQYHGDFFDIPESIVDLRPVQPGGPPILLAGYTPAAMRRIGRAGDGWILTELPEGTASDLWDVARRAADAAGRDPDGLRRVVRVNAGPGDGVDQVAVRLERLAGNNGAFVDLCHAVRSVDEALEFAAALAERRHDITEVTTGPTMVRARQPRA